jgi:hypothetical protein
MIMMKIMTIMTRRRIIMMDHVHIESPRTWHFKNMQPFHNSGAEQRHGCIEHVSTHPTNIGHLNQSSQLCLKNDTYLQPPTR